MVPFLCCLCLLAVSWWHGTQRRHVVYLRVAFYSLCLCGCKIGCGIWFNVEYGTYITCHEFCIAQKWRTLSFKLQLLGDRRMRWGFACGEAPHVCSCRSLSTVTYRGSPPNDHLHPTNTLSKIDPSHTLYHNSTKSTFARSML
jgi:hypothetical protein